MQSALSGSDQVKIDLGYDYEKMTSSLRGFYTGAGYYGAVIVLDRAREVHSGTRKNGFPEFSHQIMQASVLRGLPRLLYPELVHITVLAHDLDEDHSVSVEDTCEAIRKAVPSDWSGHSQIDLLPDTLERMNKYELVPVLDQMRLGAPQRRPKPTEVYYGEIASDPIASLAKGLDRDHNLSSMIEVFSVEKMRQYIGETIEYVLPMLKEARKRFPSQEPAYQNIRHQINYKLYMAKRWAELREENESLIEDLKAAQEPL
jgi:hypothetical protein